jgi:4-hydroxybenzoyl-CoA thioesterase
MQPFRTELTVRFGDIDLAGIVYYPRFLHFFHIAMEEFFAGALGLDYAAFLEQYRLGLPTVHLEVDFRRPLRYGDRIAIEVGIERLGDSSIAWRYRVFRGAEVEPAAEGRVVTVNMDMDRHEKEPLPAWLRERLEAWLNPTRA